MNESLLQGARAWIADALELPDPNNQVIPAAREGDGLNIAPPTPYLVVTVLDHERDVAVVEITHYPDRTIRRVVREATIRVTGVGAGSGEWLACLGFMTDKASFNVAGTQGIKDISQILEGEDFEEMYSADFDIEYEARLVTPPAPAAATLAADIDVQDFGQFTVEVSKHVT